VKNPARYHFFFSNCEHISNHISKGRFTSMQVHFACWNFFRFLLCCIGLVFLNFAAGSCYHKFCISHPVGAMLAYYLFSTVPVFMQAAVSFMLVVKSVHKQYAQALIDYEDFCHLVCKETARMLIVGGGAGVATLLVPQLVSRTEFTPLACVLCVCVYVASDLVYNCAAHAIMRLVLLPVWGKVWLLGAAPSNHYAGSKLD